MRLTEPAPRRAFENILPLINVVFLMLIFFLAAGTLKPFAELDVTPARTAAETASEHGRDTVLVDADGQIAFQGGLLTEAELEGRLKLFAASNPAEKLNILADRTLASQTLISVLAVASRAGLKNISLVTARGNGK